MRLSNFEQSFYGSILCGIVYVLYIYRQTIEASSHNSTIIFITAIFLTIAIIINIKYIYIEIIKNWRDIFLCALSVLICCLLFHDLSTGLLIISKCLLILFVGLIAIKSNGQTLIIMADFGALFLFAMGVFILSGLIEANLISNDVWVKNNFGFKNPNIGPYFALSSLFIYFITGERLRFACFALLICFAYIFFSVHSRTYYIGALLLVIYMLIDFNQIKLRNFICAIILCIFLIVLIYLLLALLIFAELIFIDGWISSFDLIISARLTKIYEMKFFISEVGSIVKVNPLDNIFYELIINFGPYITYIFLKNFIKILSFYKLTNKDVVFYYGFSVFLLTGMFEGLFVKFSPMVVALVLFIFIKNNQNKTKIFS